MALVPLGASLGAGGREEVQLDVGRARQPPLHPHAHPQARVHLRHARERGPGQPPLLPPLQRVGVSPHPARGEAMQAARRARATGEGAGDALQPGAAAAAGPVLQGAAVRRDLRRVPESSGEGGRRRGAGVRQGGRGGRVGEAEASGSGGGEDHEVLRRRRVDDHRHLQADDRLPRRPAGHHLPPRHHQRQRSPHPRDQELALVQVRLAQERGVPARCTLLQHQQQGNHRVRVLASRLRAAARPVQLLQPQEQRRSSTLHQLPQPDGGVTTEEGAGMSGCMELNSFSGCNFIELVGIHMQ
eukprot:749729-Hanusia_phi.AAC.3